jgi:hypothetical protein
MLLKQCFTAIAMAFLLISAQASPVQEEKLAFCQTVAKNYKSGQDARKLGMDEADLNGRLMQFVMGLIQNGLPDEMIKMLVQPILDGYHGNSSAKAHYEACMSLNI